MHSSNVCFFNMLNTILDNCITSADFSSRQVRCSSSLVQLSLIFSILPLEGVRHFKGSAFPSVRQCSSFRYTIPSPAFLLFLTMAPTPQYLLRILFQISKRKRETNHKCIILYRSYNCPYFE